MLEEIKNLDKKERLLWESLPISEEIYELLSYNNVYTNKEKKMLFMDDGYFAIDIEEEGEKNKPLSKHVSLVILDESRDKIYRTHFYDED